MRNPWLLLVGTGVVVIVAVVGYSAYRGLRSTDAPLPSPKRETVPVKPDDQLDLAERYRPILLFDSSESWRPLNVDRFLDDPGRKPTRLCHPGEKPDSCPPIQGRQAFLESIAREGKASRDDYLNLGGEQANGTDFEGPIADCPERSSPLQDCDDGQDAAIYYEVKQANGRFYIDYWWFYRYNDYRQIQAVASCTVKFRPLCGDHEGDWEGITVVTSAFKPGEIEYITYAEHSGDFRYGSSQFQVGGELDTRPEVYVADGTHASYPGACTGQGCAQLLPASVGTHRPEGRHDGVAKWGRNSGDRCSEGPDCLLPLPPEPGSWDTFGGLWGLKCGQGGPDCPVNAGPQTPSAQDRFIYPWCYQRVLPSGKDFERFSSCDLAARDPDPRAKPGTATQTDCRAWAGSNVAILACNADALAHTLAGDSATESNGISIVLYDDEDGDPATPPQPKVIGETTTRGISQVVDKALPPRYFFTVRGKITELIVRGRAASDRPLIEAKFANLHLGADDEVGVSLKMHSGKLKFRMHLPDGTAKKPDTRTKLG